MAADRDRPEGAAREYGAMQGLAGRVGPLGGATRRAATAADLHGHLALLVRVSALPDSARALLRPLDAGEGPEEVSRQAG